MSIDNFASEVAARIKTARESRNWTQRDLARESGVASASVSHAETGHRDVSPEKIAKLAHALGVSTDYLLTGHAPPAPLDPAELPQPLLRFSDALTPEARAALHTDEYLAVPLVEDAVAAGAPAVMTDAVEGWAIIYRPLVGRRTDLVAVRIRGDSMEPALPNRSLVIVDRGDRAIKDGRVYAVRLDGGVTVKYVRLDGRTLHLLPENRAHLPAQIEIEDEAASPIIGRVCYSWRSWVDDEDDPGQVAEKRARYRVGKK